MTIRDTVIDFIGGKKLQQERAKTQEAFSIMEQAYQEGRFRVPPERLVQQLSELDSSTIMYLLRGMQTNVTGLPWNASTEDQRIYQVNESRYQWYYNPLAQWAVWTWTNNGLGEKVTVTCNDDKAQERWEYTWQNSPLFDDDHIQENSNWVLRDGEIYLAAYHSIADGETVFELLDTDEIKEICCNPENKNEPLYYKREYTGADNVSYCIYYPDYHAYFKHPEQLKKYALPSDAKTSISEAMDEYNGTTVTVLHIAHNRKDQSSLHGWPILGIAAPYFRAQKEYVETRLTVARQKASFAREFITQGGSRGVAAVKARFGTQLNSSSIGTGTTIDPNPPAIPGSSLIHNDAVEHRDLPMTTGAGDATSDNNMFSWMALIGAGLFPTTAGMDTSRWATALAMDKNQSVLWSRYQSFWSAQFRKMVEITLLAAEEWGKKKFEDKGCKVSIDTLSLVDFPGVVEPISSMLDAVSSLTTDGTLNANSAKMITKAFLVPVLSALGTEDIDDILNDDALGIMEPEEFAKQAKAVTERFREFALAARRRKKAGSDG